MRHCSNHQPHLQHEHNSVPRHLYWRARQWHGQQPRAQQVRRHLLGQIRPEHWRKGCHLRALSHQPSHTVAPPVLVRHAGITEISSLVAVLLPPAASSGAVQRQADGRSPRLSQLVPLAPNAPSALHHKRDYVWGGQQRHRLSAHIDRRLRAHEPRDDERWLVLPPVHLA